jgi:hypothetical protein
MCVYISFKDNRVLVEKFPGQHVIKRQRDDAQLGQTQSKLVCIYKLHIWTVLNVRVGQTHRITKAIHPLLLLRSSSRRRSRLPRAGAAAFAKMVPARGALVRK